MNSLDPDYRMQAYSFYEVIRQFERAVIDLDHITFNGRKVSAGHVLNAIVLEWTALNPEEREKVVRSGIRRLEEAAVRDAASDAKPSPTAPAEVKTSVRHVRDGTSTKAVGRKKGR